EPYAPGTLLRDRALPAPAADAGIRGRPADPRHRTAVRGRRNPVFDRSRRRANPGVAEHRRLLLRGRARDKLAVTRPPVRRLVTGRWAPRPPPRRPDGRRRPAPPRA